MKKVFFSLLFGAAIFVDAHHVHGSCPEKVTIDQINEIKNNKFFTLPLDSHKKLTFVEYPKVQEEYSLDLIKSGSINVISKSKFNNSVQKINDDPQNRSCTYTYTSLTGNQRYFKLQYSKDFREDIPNDLRGYAHFCPRVFQKEDVERLADRDPLIIKVPNPFGSSPKEIDLVHKIYLAGPQLPKALKNLMGKTLDQIKDSIVFTGHEREADNTLRCFYTVSKEHALVLTASLDEQINQLKLEVYQK